MFYTLFVYVDDVDVIYLKGVKASHNKLDKAYRCNDFSLQLKNFCLTTTVFFPKHACISLNLHDFFRHKNVYPAFNTLIFVEIYSYYFIIKHYCNF